MGIILNGTNEQRRKLQLLHKKQLRGKQSGNKIKALPSTQSKESSSEDEFEREMNAELEKNVKSLEDSRGRASNVAGNRLDRLLSTKTEELKIPSEEFYDEVYFDSEEEEEMEEEKTSRKASHAVI